MVNMFLWHEIYEETWLLKATLKLHTKTLFDRQKAFTTSHDGQTFFDFSQKAPQKLKTLHQQLQNGTFVFRPAEARHFVFNGRARTLYLLPWEERIVDTMLYLMLNHLLSAKLSQSSYAYRMSGLTLALCQKKIGRLTANPKQPLYIIKRDMADYFASVDHTILKQSLNPYFDQSDPFSRLLFSRIRFDYLENGQRMSAIKGIPFGCATACFFANWYLNPLDEAMAACKDAAYFRYSDDCLAITPHRETAEKVDGLIAKVIGNLKLSFKPKHHHNWVYASNSPSDLCFSPIDRFKHLGLEFRAKGPHGLSKDKLRKIRNLFSFSFRRQQNQWKKLTDPEAKTRFLIRESRRVVFEGLRSVAILDYYLDHTADEAQLRELDRWLALEILATVFESGHKKGLFARVSFNKLRNWGLPSLCHRSRELRHGHIKKSFFFWKKPLSSRASLDRDGAKP